ncbi:FkbM family methyltransferase [Candidatus Woesearchaeota archaeon]|nr:FkbM family methyltransferase [Candidatus Woesearchaeota archaeon]
MKLKGLLYNFGLKPVYSLFYLGDWNKKTVIHNVDGKAKFKLRVNTSDKMILMEVWKTNSYIAEDFNIKKDDVVVDIGANIGAFSVLAAKNATNGSIFAYEPDKENYEILKKNNALNNLHNVFVSNLAVTGKRGYIDFFASKLNNGGHSIYSTDSKKVTKVKSTTLSDIFKINNLKKINYLKIDAEGAEYDALLNTPAPVIRKVDKIVLEYHNYLDSAHNHIELKDYLENNGFKVEISRNTLFRRMFGTGMIKARR